MERKVTLLDGAVGTSLWAKAAAHGYERVPVWMYNIEHPDIVEELVQEYAAAGSQIILANTFGANGPAVKRSSDYTTPQVVRAGVEITKRVLAGTGIKTALAIGPLSTLLEPYGDMEEDECRAIYTEMIAAGMEAGAEAIMIQTFLDLAMMRIAAEIAVGYGVPVFCTMTFEKVGKTMMGNSVEDVIRELEPLGIAGIGMNCSLGPDMALPIIREFAQKTTLPLVFKPNAGLPISAAGSNEVSACDAASFARAVAPALEYVSYIGGCCGSDPGYVTEIAKVMQQ